MLAVLEQLTSTEIRSGLLKRLSITFQHSKAKFRECFGRVFVGSAAASSLRESAKEIGGFLDRKYSAIISYCQSAFWAR